MRRRLPPLNALHAFEAAARLGSFTGAARELGVAQPAVTRHVANLEAWVDTALFERHGNRIWLTETGRIVADLATAAFDRIEIGMRDLPSARDDEILIGASFGVTHLWLMPRLAAMRGATEATVNFVTADDYRSFEDGAVDMSIRFGTGSFPGYAADLLFPECCYLVAAADYSGAYPGLDPVDLARTLRPEWMLDHGDPHGAGWLRWPDWFAALGAPQPHSPPSRQLRNYPAMLDMVRHGEGVAIGSVGLEDAFVERGEIVRLGPPVARPGHGYYLVYREGAMERPGFQALRDLFLGRRVGGVGQA